MDRNQEFQAGFARANRAAALYCGGFGLFTILSEIVHLEHHDVNSYEIMKSAILAIGYLAGTVLSAAGFVHFDTVVSDAQDSDRVEH